MFCWFFKLLISHNLDNKTKSRFVAKHLTACKSCDQFYNFAKYLEDKLKQDAKTLQPEYFLRTDNAKKIKKVTASNTTKIKPALLAAAACITIAVIFSVASITQKAAETKKMKQAKSQETLNFAISTHKLIIDHMQGKDSSSKFAQLMTNQYETEIDNIKNETKTALKFLVSCVEVHIDDNQKDAIVN